jgi:hypothetical protein
MHSIRRQIDFAWPSDCAVFNKNACEMRQVGQLCEDSGALATGPAAGDALEFEVDEGLGQWIVG